MSSNAYIGSSLDEMVRSSRLTQLRSSLAWQIEQAMVEKKLTKTKMNEMKTGRASLARLLDPENTSVTLSTMERGVVGKRLRLDLVDAT